MAAPPVAEAAKTSKADTRLCKRQVNACTKAFRQACQGGEICLSLATCCKFLKTCDAAGQIKCITDIL